MGQSKWECSMSILIAGFMSCHAAVYGDVPAALVGGQGTGTNTYAAFLPNLNGEIVPITGVPSTGTSSINSVSLNSLGEGLIGGRSDSAAYSAFVSSDGVLFPLSLSIPTGEIYSVAINTGGLGLVGGVNIGANSVYAAHVLSDGTVTPISAEPYRIYEIALNDAGVGLIGGEGSGGLAPYAAYVSPEGMVTEVGDLTTDFGRILTVSINEAGSGIVGGQLTSAASYAALIFPSEASIPLLSFTNSFYSCSAINESGAALIGGQTGSDAYALHIAPNGDPTVLLGRPFAGTVNSVALNDSGMGLVGGDSSSNLYAVLIQPDLTAIPLFSLPVGGVINAVAINDEGVGLIGGSLTEGSVAYLAIVAPDGTLNPIDLSSESSISSVSIQRGSSAILDQAVPQSIGPFAGPINTQLAAATVLETRLIQQNRIWTRMGKNRNNETDENNLNMAYSDTSPAQKGNPFALSPEIASTPRGSISSCNSNTIWLEPFGNYVHLKNQGSIPALTNQIGGALLGYDRQGANYIVGITGGYGFNYVHESNSLGHAKVQEEMLSLYASYYTDHFWFATALWGALYQTTNVRHTLSQITSVGKPHGSLLQPHLELATPWALTQDDLYFIEPFAQFDWVNNWQDAYTESGSSGLNVQMPSFYNSLLQSEIGLRFYERFIYSWGDLCLEEKVSYINQTPFNVQSVETSFVGSASSFPVAVASSKSQNMGSVQWLACFVPRNSSYPYGGFSFQATIGEPYQSYFGSLFTGVNF